MHAYKPKHRLKNEAYSLIYVHIFNFEVIIDMCILYVYFLKKSAESKYVSSSRIPSVFILSSLKLGIFSPESYLVT